MNVLVNLGVCIFDGWMYYNFWNHFLKLKMKKPWFSVLVMSLGMGMLFGVNQMQLAGWNLAASLIVSVSVSQCLFSDAAGKKIFYAVLSFFIVICCEFVMVLVANLPLGKFAIDYSVDTWRMTLLTVSTKLLTFLVFRILCYLSDGSKKLFFSSIAPYFYCFPFTCLVLFIGIANSSLDLRANNIGNNIIIIGCLLLFVSNIVLFVVYDRMVYMLNRIKEYEIIEVKTELESKHYIQVEEINRKHEEILHDMNDFLKTIESLASEANNDEIVGILTSLDFQIVGTNEGFYCNQPILNAVLNDKKTEAEFKNISYHVQIEPGFKLFGIDDIDIISIMSNLIGNAIEAAEKCQDGNVDIQIFQSNDGRFATIKIKNNYKIEPVVENGEFLTKKETPEMHGIGLRHVKRIVENYGGWINLQFEDYQFCATVMFAIDNDKGK